MYLKIHKRGSEVVVAVCDKELIGKVFDDGKVRLDLSTYREFYEGTISNRKEVIKALKNFSSANLVGRRATTVAMELGLIRKNEVAEVAGIPHVQIYRI